MDAPVLTAVAITAILLLATLALLLSAPVDGDFGWGDAPRHAMNGIFIKDFVAARPFHDPMGWAINYYLARPALTILFYPPLFYCLEAIGFSVFGVSHLVAQATVALFILLLAVASYNLARFFLPRWSALGAALLVIGAPEAAFWGRQVMLDVPAYALIVTSAWCLGLYIRHGHPYAIYLTAGFLLAAIYTKYNAGFVAPALAIALLVDRGPTALRDRHVLIAAALAVVGVLPAILLLRKFGAANLQSVSGMAGTYPLDSLECWLFYLKAVPEQIGIVPTVLALCGLVLLAAPGSSWRPVWRIVLLLGWLLVGYLFFTLISLKEPRDTIMVLFPLAIVAALVPLRLLPKPVGELAGLALGVGMLAYTLVFCQVIRVQGYKEIAAYLAANVPRDGVVAYFGYRDANLIFDLSTIPERNDIAVVRIDKLLLSAPVGERRRGIKQVDYTEAGVTELLRGLGVTYFVVQPEFWSDLQVMGYFDHVIHSADYQKIAHFDLTGDLSSQDGRQGIDIFRPTYPVARKSHSISIDMPLAGQRFEGDLRK